MIEVTYVDVINDSLKKPLIEYKYEGKDDSILYDKVISPLCQKIVDDYLPVTIAPNTITVVGFAANTFPHLLIILTDQEGVPVSRFLCLLQGVLMLFYSVAYKTDPDLR